MQAPDAEHTNSLLTATGHDVPDNLAAPPGWEPVEQVHLPGPTYWPAVLALGVTFVAWGIVTSLLILAVGVILCALAIGGWIGDLLHEP